MMRAAFLSSLPPVLLAAAALASLPKVDADKAAVPRIEAVAQLAPAKPSAPADPKEEIRSLARRGLLDSALTLCRQVLEADSADAFARFMSGKLAPEGKASAEHFRRVLDAGKTGPEAEESRFRLGQYHYAAGKYHLAIPCFRDYLKLHPKGDWKEPAHYWMGRACLALAQGRPDRAAYLDSGLAYFGKLLAMSPPEQYYHALAREGMAKVKLAQGDWSGAWEQAQGALATAPEDERASILLLAAQLRRGVDREEEKRMLQRLASEHPQSPEVRHLRRLNGNTDPAKWRAPAPAGKPPAPPDSDRRGADSAAAKNPATPGKPGPGAAAGPGPEVTPRLPTPGAPPGPPAPGTAATPAPAPGGAYTLQLGAFAQSANAEALVAELARQGFSPEVAARMRGGKTIYQVRLGRFASAEEAQEYARVHLKPKKLLSQPVPAQ